MLRQKLINRNRNGAKKDVIEWRSHETFRIEAFSDAVFAFSITLLIVSLEVPKNYNDLIKAMQGFFPFALCFLILFQIWYLQFKYFRRYALENFYTIVLNAVLVFVILFYMYPLKFLFDLLLPGGDIENIDITYEQISVLMIIFGVGFISVQFIFALLYQHAISHKDGINLTEAELFETLSELYFSYLKLVIGAISVLIAWLIPSSEIALAGWIYILIFPARFIFFYNRKKIYKKKFTT